MSACCEQTRDQVSAAGRWRLPPFAWQLATCCLALVWLTGATVSGQEPAASEAASSTANPLAEGQKDIAARFSRLEDLLLHSAELEAAENPTRAALLQQAVQLSKQAQLNELLAKAASNLESKQYSEAIEQQKVGRENLKRLLELLQSENREQRVREKRDQVRLWIEETDRLLRLQSSLRGRTEGGQSAEQAAGDQRQLADKAANIANDLKGDEASASPSPEDAPPSTTPPSDANAESDADSSDPSQGEQNDAQQDAQAPAGGDEPRPSEEQQPATPPADPKSPDSAQPSPDGQPQQGQPQQGQPQQGQPQQGQPQQGQPQQGQPQQGQPQQGQPQQGQPQQGQPQQGQPQQGQPQQGQPQQEQSENQSTPSDPTERARQRIEQAQQRMQEAQQKLEEAEREGAVEKQMEAEEQLREAIEELEEILRQLREEEIERSLASLETRLRRMLEMQTRVVEETQRLQEISGEQATRQVEIRANSLARDQRKILAEGERAQLLLREEGSSAAFPEALEQVNLDIANVAERLEEADVGKLTLVIEQEIVISLEEMVAALVQVQKDNQEKQQQRQSGQPQAGQPGEQPLVDKLAELRLIRTLQVRINNRTNTLSELLADPADPIGQAAEGDVLEQLRGLAERQSSIQQVTRDIVVGKGE